MCLICAAIPATAAIGAKMNADQIRQQGTRRLPVAKITTGVIGLLVIASALYHAFRWEAQ